MAIVIDASIARRLRDRPGVVYADAAIDRRELEGIL